jgi:TetR/AcrR family transcriptional regulator, repressor for neighboring sulfatase
MTPETSGTRRPRRSREEVGQALIDAAAELLAERSSGHVTVRDIAARADVNPTLIHRYFGTKRNLMHAAVDAAQRRLVASVDEMPNVIDGAYGVFHAVLAEKGLIASFARATLDGVLDDLPRDNPGMTELINRFAAELEGRGTPGRHDPRIIVACLASAAMGYALFGEMIRRGAGLDGEPENRVEAAMVAALQDLSRAALGDIAPATDRP